MYINDIEVPIAASIKFDMERKKQGRSIQWIADYLVISYQHAYRILNNKVVLTENNRRKLNELLNVNY